MPNEYLNFCCHFFGCSFDDRAFAAKFGVDATVCNYLYAKVLPLGLPLKELLMTLHFLKCYNTYDSARTEWKCSERHYRTVLDRGIQALLSSLNEVLVFLYVCQPNSQR